MRLRNVVALGLTPVRIKSQFDWDPADDYWGEDRQPLPGWAVAIVERGTRPGFEMEPLFDRFADALRVFHRLLWLNPSDNQGIRFLLEDVHAGRSWDDRHCE